ncbi:MAG: hypothetical protein RML72_04835 [Bacteroidia bacterium]|nr:hypothetical protein [Bacteroidia bacterium]MDW8158188.1 hypothetical protein [Bacteroidia bacterium]
MVGTAKVLIDSIIFNRAKGDDMVAAMIRTKLALKGINCTKYKGDTPDDPKIIERLLAIARDFGIAEPVMKQYESYRRRIQAQ